jgi:zinc/manganese transport system substrate-binding protein
MILIIDRNPRTSKTWRVPVIGLVIAVVVAGCGAGADPGTAGGISVVATTSIVGDIAANVVGDEGSVEILIPIGVDAHDFQASARQAAQAAAADLVVANGLGLEHDLQDMLSTVAADGTPVVELAPAVDPLPRPGGGEDPHFWMDPDRVAAAAAALAGQLAVLEPEGGWLDRADRFGEEMARADATVTENLSAIPEDGRKMVTNHESFRYFADRYDFEIVGVVIPGGSTQAEPGSAEIAQLVSVMREQGVAVIFAETTQPATLADAVAAELGGEVSVIELYTESLGPAGSGAETLAGMLTTNSQRIVDSLVGEA